MGEDVKVRYRRVSVKVWGDEKVQQLNGYGQMLWFFLMTHPNLQAFGAMRHTQHGLAHELGAMTKWPPKRFVTAYGDIIDLELAEHSPAHSFICLPNFLDHNPPGNPNQVKGWDKYVQLVPECHARDLHFARCRAFAEAMGKSFSKALPEAFLKALPEALVKDCGQGSRNSESESEVEVFQTSQGAEKKLSKPQRDIQRILSVFTVRGVERPSKIPALAKMLKRYRDHYGKDQGLDRLVENLLAVTWPADIEDVDKLALKVLSNQLNTKPGGPAPSRRRKQPVDTSAADATRDSAGIFG